MELIDRYLQAVKFWLPKQQKQDIIAELSEDIYAQVEEQESGLGRKLNEAEVGALLKKRGRPVLVANSYLPQEYLIGPVMFPIYLLVLKVVALCYLVPWVLVRIGLMLYSPADGLEQAGHSWVAAFDSLWGSFWLTAFVSTGVVTIVFAVLERVQAESHFLEKWDPRKLPPVRTPSQIPRSNSIIELVVNLMFFAWWAGHMSSPVVLNHPDIRITFTPLWSYFFWGFLVTTLVNASLAAANFMRPYRTRLRATLRLLSDFAGAALFCWLLKVNILSGIALANVPAAKAIEITNAMNWWMSKMFPWAIVVCIVITVVNAFKIIRVKPSGVRPAHQATIVAALLLLAIGAGLRVLPERQANSSPQISTAAIHSLGK